jgi:Holliday junction resolvase RusA-like endonuclease
MIELTIEGQVVPLKTHRPLGVSKKTGKPYMYESKELRAYRKSATEQLKEQYEGSLIEGDVWVKFSYYVKDRRNRDLVNLLETTSDLLQGIVIADDSQIYSYDGSRIADLDKDNPRTEIEIEVFEVW